VAKILPVLVWWAGLAVIFSGAALLASRSSRAFQRAGGPSRPAGLPLPPPSDGQAPVRDAVRFLIFAAVGVAAVFVVMALLGILVRHAGPAVDKPFYHWSMSHRSHLWKRVMTSATKIGDTWTTRAAAATAAVCLAVTWRRMRWLPALAFVAVSVVQRLVTHAIHAVDHRVGPPGHLHGTFPSGGSDRAILFYGLIAYLLWREFSGSRRAAIWSAAVVAALGFNEGYSRLYLGMHWMTDVLSGWLYGILLLAVFITAVRIVMGPARAPQEVAAERELASAATAAGAVPEGPR
jgi:membrane-associated phospholipid phosphatase